MISVIVPAYNEEEYIEECIGYLKKQKTTYPYEIIVVDNNSEDKTSELAQSLDVKVVKEERQGVSIARNTGIEESKGDILVFIDADCLAPPDHLDKIGRYFENNPKVSAVGGYYKFHKLNKILGFFLYRLNLIYLYFLSRRITGGVWFLMGGNSAVRKTDLKEIGGFLKDLPGDTEYIKKNVYPEDLFLSIKLDLKGKEIRFKSKFYVYTILRRLDDKLKDHIERYFYDTFLIFKHRIDKTIKFFKSKHGKVKRDMEET